MRQKAVTPVALRKMPESRNTVRPTAVTPLPPLLCSQASRGALLPTPAAPVQKRSCNRATGAVIHRTLAVISLLRNRPRSLIPIGVGESTFPTSTTLRSTDESYNGNSGQICPSESELNVPASVNSVMLKRKSSSTEQRINGRTCSLKSLLVLLGDIKRHLRGYAAR